MYMYHRLSQRDRIPIHFRPVVIWLSTPAAKLKESLAIILITCNDNEADIGSLIVCIMMLGKLALNASYLLNIQGGFVSRVTS